MDLGKDENEQEKKTHSIIDLFRHAALRKNIIYGTINYFFC